MNYGIIIYILGWVVFLTGSFMTLPCICAAIYQEQQGIYYMIVALSALLIGFLITRKKPKNHQFFAREGLLMVGSSWIVMSMIAALPFTLCGDIPFYVDALFESVSGFTTTGASILTDVEALCHASLLWRSFTHWIGGMGVFVFLLAVLPMVGGYNMHIMRAESPGPSVGKLVPKVRDTAKILYLIYFGLTVLMMIILIIAKMPVFDAICTAVGTAGTGGFGIKGDSMASYSPLIQWIVTIFMVLFGVNFNFYFFLLLGKGRNKKNAFKMEEVRWYIGLFILASVVISVNILSMMGSYSESIRHASFSVATVMTTTGFATEDFDLWPTLSKTILVAYMFLGACAGSTGGGIKVSRIVLVFKMVRQEIRSFIHPRSVKTITLDGKPVEKDTLRGVSVYICTFSVLFIVSMLLIAIDGFSFTTTFTSVTATINNIGPGLEICGPTGNYASFSVLSKFVFMFDMLAGRLELYPLLVLFAPRMWKKNS
ncbi:MAG: TrkH family potassium uptake protein [Lachnospiraceae bacterium]|nr:TrkH family potassium uptake protein [Lachnospiraceae bacterium]